MKVYINHDFEYDVKHLLKNFDQTFECANQDDADLSSISEKYTVRAEYENLVFEEEVDCVDDPIIQKRLFKQANSRVIYDLCSKLFNKKNEWGTLVGVRPAKIVHQLYNDHTSEEIDKILYERYRLAESKRKLLLEISKREQPFLEVGAVSLYICIPFCPTRCLYCSFPSNDTRKKGHLIDTYLTCLLKEIHAAYKGLQESGKVVDCIYIGGGTPSILSADQFEVLLKTLSGYFDLSALKEFTIEAGRPDTITENKLKVFKAYDVSRLCLNPQSMNEKTLKVIGRDHSVDSIYEVYDMIKSYNFNSINMDIILGLPDEDIDDVKHTLDAIVRLNPENITVHTLAVKTSSRLKEKLEEYEMTQGEMVEEMLRLSEDAMSSNGYYPYYLYRQKNMVGNFENVGYAKDGYESLYNIRIIEEQHDILALGAGAVSKKCYSELDRFDRIANIKGLEQYIDRIDEVIEKTSQFFKD